MAVADSLLPEFDHEMGNSRRALQSVPAQFDWRPHPKSWTLGQLATHVAQIPFWSIETLRLTELDLQAGGPPRAAPTTTAEVVELFEKNVKEGRERLQSATDADLVTPWTLKAGTHVIFTLPRIAVYRGFVMNHMIHHRGQLTVYLRLLDVPVPGLYGPSADEKQ